MKSQQRYARSSNRRHRLHPFETRPILNLVPFRNSHARVGWWLTMNISVSNPPFTVDVRWANCERIEQLKAAIASEELRRVRRNRRATGVSIKVDRPDRRVWSARHLSPQVQCEPFRIASCSLAVLRRALQILETLFMRSILSSAILTGFALIVAYCQGARVRTPGPWCAVLVVWTHDCRLHYREPSRSGPQQPTNGYCGASRSALEMAFEKSPGPLRR